MSDPAFLQFAEEMRRVQDPSVQDYHRCYTLSNDQLAQAERHARLLAAVWEWANAQVPPVTFYAPGQLKEREQYHKGISYSQAHVRALLAQSEEQER